MTTTSTQLTSEITKGITDNLLSGIETGTKQAYQVWWDALISFLFQHWLAVMVALVVIFLIALVKALGERWGMLGSVLYNYLYFGILLVIGLIWGSDVFVSNYFTLAGTVILYPVCYYLVGKILNITGIRRR